MFDFPALFFEFLTASLLVNLIPGSDRFYVIATSLRHGLKSGWYASVGISTGIFIHSLIGAFGLGALIQAYPFIFNLIRIAGIVVLFLLGLQIWVRNSTQAKGQFTDTKIEYSAYWQGLLVHFLNPIAIVFSFTFIPEFIDSDGHFVGQFLMLSAVGNLISLIVNSMTAAAIHILRKQISIGEKWVHILSGLILIGLSIQIAITWL